MSRKTPRGPEWTRRANVLPDDAILGHLYGQTTALVAGTEINLFTFYDLFPNIIVPPSVNGMRLYRFFGSTGSATALLRLRVYRHQQIVDEYPLVGLSCPEVRLHHIYEPGEVVDVRVANIGAGNQAVHALVEYYLF